MHPVRLLLLFLPELLVELGPLSRSGHPSSGLSLAGRQPRRICRRAARRSGGSVPPLSLPYDHELRKRLPEGAEPGQGDRRNQEAAAGAGGIAPSPPSALAFRPCERRR